MREAAPSTQCCGCDCLLVEAGYGGYFSTKGNSGLARMAVKLPDFDQWIDAMAPVLGLNVTAEQRAGVKANLKTAAKMAALLDKAKVGDEIEPAPVFRA